ncbi:MAG: type II toxin-antitoxin system VapC family toxin [Waterburya sp.]
MIVAVADTHTIIWYLFNDTRLSYTARQTIEAAAEEGNSIAIASITLAEIVYLSEKKRIPDKALERLLNSIDEEDSVLTEISLDRNVVKALAKVKRTQIPDLPDRIIAATALYVQVPVISRDRKIKLSDIQTIW